LVGKSAVANGYLQKSAFQSSDEPNSCTLETSSAENTVNNIKRIVIDTQGLDDSKGLDDPHLTQMVQFLRNWNNGLHAIGIVINGQNPRLDMGTRKLIHILHNFFNNNNIWNSTFIVFTRWYKSVMTDEQKIAKRHYVDEARKVIQECIGSDSINIPLPYFFVDAKPDFNSFDMETKDEFTAMNVFAVGKEPISTQNFRKADPVHEEKIPEHQTRVFIKFSDDGMKRIRIYADQVRYELIAYDKSESYTDWENTTIREIVDQKIIKEEFQMRVEVSSRVEPMFRYESCGRREILGILGPREDICQVFDHNAKIIYYEDRKREVITDFDRNVHYGEWVVINNYQERIDPFRG